MLNCYAFGYFAANIHNLKHVEVDKTIIKVDKTVHLTFCLPNGFLYTCWGTYRTDA